MFPCIDLMKRDFTAVKSFLSGGPSCNSNKSRKESRTRQAVILTSRVSSSIGCNRIEVFELFGWFQIADKAEREC